MPCQKNSRWKGCCCVCKHRTELFKHCCHSPKPEGTCVCSESLGIFVCIVWVNYDGHWERKVHLCGEHGYCELYEAIPKGCPTCDRGPNPNLESYPCHECDARNGFHAWSPRVVRGSCAKTETREE